MSNITTNELSVHYLLDRPEKLPRQHRTMTGQSLAKRHDLNPRKRAREAALWILGDLDLKPTLKAASLVFSVSIALIMEERDYLLATTEPEPRIDHIWAAMSVSEREAFVRNHLPDLWSHFDRVTANAA